MRINKETADGAILAGGIVIAIAFVWLMTTIDKHFYPNESPPTTPNFVLPPSEIDDQEPPSPKGKCLDINSPTADNFIPDKPTVLFASDAAIKLGITDGVGVLVWISHGRETIVSFGPNFEGLPDLVHNKTDTFCLP